MQNLVCCSILNFVDKYLTDGELTDLTCHYIPLIKQVGFDGIELFLRDPSVQDIKKIKYMSRKQNLPVTSVHFPKSLLDEPIESCFPRIKNLVQVALSLECDLSIVHPPWPGTREASKTSLISLLYKVLPWTESQEFRFSVETTPIKDCDAYFYDVLQGLGREGIYLTLDMEFLATVGASAGQFCRLVGVMPENIHVNDYDGSPVDRNGNRRYPLLGQGIIDLEDEGKQIRQMGYEGILTLETSLTHLKDPLNELNRSRKFITDYMA